MVIVVFRRTWDKSELDAKTLNAKWRNTNTSARKLSQILKTFLKQQHGAMFIVIVARSQIIYLGFEQDAVDIKQIKAPKTAVQGFLWRAQRAE